MLVQHVEPDRVCVIAFNEYLSATMGECYIPLYYTANVRMKEKPTQNVICTIQKITPPSK